MSTPTARVADRRLTVDDLSLDQREVYESIVNWTSGIDMETGANCGILTCGGFAGVGKSSLLGVFAADTKLQVAYVSYTGRAASVLGRKLKACGAVTTDKTFTNSVRVLEGRFGHLFSEDPTASFCGTLHRLLYRPLVNEKTDELLGWSKRESLDRQYDLIVVDEASMISDEILLDLKGHGIPILAVGDHGQLPPVAASGDLMQNPILRLEKIHRQAESNPIIALSKVIRETGRLESKIADGKRIRFALKADLPLVLEAAYESDKPLDVGILCWTNKTRVRLNGAARKAQGFSGPPRKGEVVICLRNKPPVYNGMRGLLVKDALEWVSSNTGSYADFPWKPRPWHLQSRVEFPDEGIDAADYTLCAPQFMRETTFKDLEELRARGIDVERVSDAGFFADFGYAMTVHKCVAPETLVETSYGLVEAGRLNPNGGKIATPTGRSEYRKLVRNKSSRMLEIETVDGYTLRCTYDHGVDTWNPNYGYVRVEADKLSAGDFVRLRLGAEFDTQNLLMHVGAPQDVRARLYDLPKICDVNLAEFLGLMVADGTVYKNGFRLAKRHEDVADRFDQLCRSLFGAKPSRFFKLGAHHVEVSSTLISDWLREVGGLEPNAKRVPQCVVYSSLASQARFLRGLFEDGTVNLHAAASGIDVIDHIEFSSSEREVREIVRTILLRFGVVCGATSTADDRVNIYGKYTKIFAEKIGFVAEFKNKRLRGPTAEGTQYVFPLTFNESKTLGRDGRVRRHLVAGDERFSDRVGFHHSPIRAIRRYIGPSVCVEVPSGHQFLQNGFCGWNSQGSAFNHAIVYLDRPVKPWDDDWKRWMYTATTRASERLTILL